MIFPIFGYTNRHAVTSSLLERHVLLSMRMILVSKDPWTSQPSRKKKRKDDRTMEAATWTECFVSKVSGASCRTISEHRLRCCGRCGDQPSGHPTRKGRTHRTTAPNHWQARLEDQVRTGQRQRVIASGMRFGAMLVTFVICFAVGFTVAMRLAPRVARNTRKDRKEA